MLIFSATKDSFLPTDGTSRVKLKAPENRNAQLNSRAQFPDAIFVDNLVDTADRAKSRATRSLHGKALTVETINCPKGLENSAQGFNPGR